MSFETIPPLLSEALAARGYEALTPVQAQVIEEGAVGRDLIVSAQTGSGKTVAFGLAFANELMVDGQLPPARLPLALVVAPTRELALQVSRELAWLYAKAGARISTCVGGMDASKERRSLAHGAHIVVGTPGRLRDHLERGALDLSGLRAVVLDEADEMLDMGFREDLEQILDGTPDVRRTLLFSATMPRPIVALAKRYQRDAVRISTVGEDRGHGDIQYQCVTVSPSDIEHSVINLLRFHEAETAMLFCATRDNVRHLHASLVERGFAAVALSGEHSQNERNAALQALRDRRARVCVATDVAARGIDLPTLSAWSSMSNCRAMPRRCSIARAAPVAQGARALLCSSCPIRAVAASRGCCAALGSPRNGSTLRPRTTSARTTANAWSPPCSRRSRSTTRIGRSPNG